MLCILYRTHFTFTFHATWALVCREWSRPIVFKLLLHVMDNEFAGICVCANTDCWPWAINSVGSCRLGRRSRGKWTKLASPNENRSGQNHVVAHINLLYPRSNVIILFEKKRNTDICGYGVEILTVNANCWMRRLMVTNCALRWRQILWNARNASTMNENVSDSLDFNNCRPASGCWQQNFTEKYADFVF